MKLKSILSSALLLVLSATFAQAAKYKLTVPHVSNTDNYNHYSLEVFKNFVESRSNGEIQVDIYPGGQLCSSAKECLAGVQSGIFDYFQTTVSELALFWKPMEGFDIPYMLKNDRVAECVYDNQIMLKDMRAEILKTTKSLRLMMISNSGGWRNIATTKKEIKKPEDVKGLKLRTVPAPIQQEMIKQLGGAPTPISWSETYTALSTGVVEGTVNSIVDIIQMRFNESLKYIILDGNAYMGGAWVMNEAKFNSFPDNLKKVVIDGIHAQNQYLRAYPKWKEFSSNQEFIKTGGKIYQPSETEKNSFIKATAGVRETFLKNATDVDKQWFTRFESEINKCETGIESDYKLEIDK